MIFTGRGGSADMSPVVAGCGSQEGLTLVQSAELLVHHRHQVRGRRAAAVLRVRNLRQTVVLRRGPAAASVRTSAHPRVSLAAPQAASSSGPGPGSWSRWGLVAAQCRRVASAPASTSPWPPHRRGDPPAAHSSVTCTLCIRLVLLK